MRKYSEKFLDKYYFLKNAVIGLEFEFYMKDLSFYKTMEMLNAELDPVKVHGFRQYHSSFKPDKNNFKFEPDLSGGSNMVELVTGPLSFYDAKYYLMLAIDQGDNQAAYILSHLDDEPIREVAQSPEPSPVSKEKTEKSDYYFSKNLLLVKPYFLSQQRQGGVPSIAFGVTPGIETESFSIKLQAAVSWLNVALGDPFTAFEVATLFGIKTNSLFYELGYGLDFWPSPGGRAHSVSVSMGKFFSADPKSNVYLKSISIGFSQTFFIDHVYKCFVALSF
jgi:hypothetical protein